MAPSKPYRFWASCSQLTGELVHYLTDDDRAVQITYGTFARHVDVGVLRREEHPATYRMFCKDNWTISFWRSSLPSGALVYFFDWSRIEHVFVDREIVLENELKQLTSITSAP